MNVWAKVVVLVWGLAFLCYLHLIARSLYEISNELRGANLNAIREMLVDLRRVRPAGS